MVPDPALAAGEIRSNLGPNRDVAYRLLVLPYNELTSLKAQVATGTAPDTALLGTNHLSRCGICCEWLDPPTESPRLLQWLRSRAGVETHIERNLLQQASGLARVRDFEALLVFSNENTILPCLSKRILRLRELKVFAMDLQVNQQVPFPALVRWLLRSATKLMVFSHSIKQNLLRLGVPDENVEFIPYGVDADFFQPEAGFSKDSILSVGQAYRDYGTLLRAIDDRWATTILTTGPRLPSRIQGIDGKALQDEVTTRRNLRVESVDYLTLRERYRDAGIVVLPLFPSTLCVGLTSLLEAMAMGKAIIVSDIPFVHDYIDDGRTGVLVRPQDSEDLRSKATELLQDGSERKRLGDAARREVVSKFSSEVLGRELAKQIVGDLA